MYRIKFIKPGINQPKMDAIVITAYNSLMGCGGVDIAIQGISGNELLE
ncbi:MAG: hypothetical protein ACK50A_11685 [Sphingobacteriaceae bacterium]|jgi:O-acetyl-ADP-ribose deacetylase (regulator of RNase III)